MTTVGNLRANRAAIARGLLIFIALWATVGFGTPPGTNAAFKASAGGFAGSQSCKECHGKFYELWSTSFHGLAMQPYTAALARTLTPQTNDIVAGKYAFRADLHKSVVTEKGPDGTHVYPIVQALGGKNVYYFLTPLERGILLRTNPRAIIPALIADMQLPVEFPAPAVKEPADNE